VIQLHLASAHNHLGYSTFPNSIQLKTQGNYFLCHECKEKAPICHWNGFWRFRSSRHNKIHVGYDNIISFGNSSEQWDWKTLRSHEVASRMLMVVLMIIHRMWISRTRPNSRHVLNTRAANWRSWPWSTTVALTRWRRRLWSRSWEAVRRTDRILPNHRAIVLRPLVRLLPAGGCLSFRCSRFTSSEAWPE